VVDSAGSKPLAGRRIALPAGRALERLVAVFREEGATPVPCPLLAIADAPDPTPVDAFLRALAAGAFDDLILLTGEGLRRLLARADRIGRGKAVRAALARVRKVTRGPKPALVLYELGLAPDLPASLPTSQGVMEALSLEPLRGRRIGVQLAGAAPNEALVSFLARQGAAVQTVAPYLYSAGVDEPALRALVAALGEGTIDAVAFTNAAQVGALYAGAAALGLEEALDAGLAGTLVAAIGPSTAAVLRERGLDPQVTPRPFVMKRLAGTVAAALGAGTGAGVNAAGGRLRGRRIAIPEHRELDRLATMLEEEGARAVRCPLMAIFDAPDPRPLEDWLRRLAAGRFDDVVFFTGEGVRRLMELAARLGIEAEVKAGLAAARKITRGPKPARALHELGLKTDLPSSAPTTAGIIDVLQAEALAGRHVAVQLYGEDPNRTLVEFLRAKGAEVHPVAPYRYAPATHDEKVATLIGELSNGLLDAIAFTTAVQVERLFQVARRRESEAALREGLSRVHVAAVGPVVIEAMERHGVRVDAVPARQFFMRRLTQEMAARLGPKGT
jgi:uroporphyrinogen-III synthase